MSIEDNVEEIMMEAYNTIEMENMHIEMNDFRRVEEHLFNTDTGITLTGEQTEFWYLTTDVDDDAIDVIDNYRFDSGEEHLVLSLRHKRLYKNMNAALADDDTIIDMKENNAVAIITRSIAETNVNDTRLEVLVTTMTTPTGVYVISRTKDGVQCKMVQRTKIVRGENKVIDGLIDAFFTW